MQLVWKLMIVTGLAAGALYPPPTPAPLPQPAPDTLATPSRFPFWEEPEIPIPSFINQALNKLYYPEHLHSFWTKIQELETGKRDQVRIVHIGDSHIQAGFVSGKLQRFLCARYGNAGRGLVFPYQVAESSPYRDLSSASNLRWERQMNISYKHTLPVGIAGFSIKTTNPAFQLRLKVKENYSSEFLFDKVTIFAPHGSQSFSLDVAEGWLETRPENAKHIPMESSADGTSSVFFDTPQYALTLFGQKESSSQTSFLLQGISLENSRQRGILYHAIGVNGATYGAYNRSADFMGQLAALQPDLVIVSLGTNEAVDAYFKPATMATQVDKLVYDIQNTAHCDAILLTSPNDILIKGSATKNPQLAATLLDQKAQQYKTAFWDFYALMGGEGSIKTWQSNGLAQSDAVHLSAKGYELQAQLLFNALEGAK